MAICNSTLYAMTLFRARYHEFSTSAHFLQKICNETDVIFLLQRFSLNYGRENDSNHFTSIIYSHVRITTSTSPLDRFEIWTST